MIPESTKIEVRRRSGDKCEYCGGLGDWRGLQFAHLVHRGIGGRNGEAETLINNTRNIAHLCCRCHDILDGRQWGPQLKAEILDELKNKLGWDAWAAECQEKKVHIRRVA